MKELEVDISRKERWIRTLDGLEVDRLVFWPKIFNQSYAAAQKDPFKQMSIREIHDYTDTDIQHMLHSCIRFGYRDCEFEEVKDGSLLVNHYRTPIGNLKGVMQYDAGTDSYHPQELAIKTVDDIRIMIRYFSDITPELDKEGLEIARAEYEELGDRGLAAESISESPLMDFIEWYAGIENGQYLIIDYPDEIEELFAQMHRVNLECTRIVCEFSPADVLYYIENTSTTIISPGQFQNYCHQHLSDYAAVCQKYERRLVFHMCGHLQKILPMLKDIPFTGIEALSSAPIGNTSMAEARAVLPNIVLIGGTNCLSWIEPVETIIHEIDGILADLPDCRGIVLGTGGIIPPACTPDKIRTINEYIQSLPMKPYLKVLS